MVLKALLKALQVVVVGVASGAMLEGSGHIGWKGKRGRIDALCFFFLEESGRMGWMCLRQQDEADLKVKGVGRGRLP